MPTLFRISSVIILALCLSAPRPFQFGRAGAGINKAATPSFNPGGFTSPGHGAQSVIISTTTAGASMRYTKDNTTPTFTTGTLVVGTSVTTSVPGNRETVVQAVAFTSASDVSDLALDVWDFTTGGGP